MLSRLPTLTPCPVTLGTKAYELGKLMSTFTAPKGVHDIQLTGNFRPVLLLNEKAITLLNLS